MPIWSFAKGAPSGGRPFLNLSFAGHGQGRWILPPAGFGAAGSFGFASDGGSGASERLQKKGIDGRKSRSYMPIHRRDTAFWPGPSASLNDR